MKIENKIETIFISKRYIGEWTSKGDRVVPVEGRFIFFFRDYKYHQYRTNSMFITTKLANTLLDRL